MTTTSARSDPGRCLRVVHLFPDLLSVYGDAGNVRTIVVRAEMRGIEVVQAAVVAGASGIPDADVLVIGGGQDREQAVVARELERLGPQIRERISDGAALLAVCGGYQSLGWSYRTEGGTEIEGPGILDVRTVAGPARMVGPVVARLVAPITSAPDRLQIIGFENHAGRTTLGPAARRLATIEIGHGNNGDDGTEGVLAMPGEDGLQGLRIGTYLHGPLLPRNPHVADALIASALARDGLPAVLDPVDDGEEWAAHEHYAARTRRRRRSERRIPAMVAQALHPLRSLIGY